MTLSARTLFRRALGSHDAGPVPGFLDWAEAAGACVDRVNFTTVRLDGRLQAVVEVVPGRAVDLVEEAVRRGLGFTSVSRTTGRVGPQGPDGGVDPSWLTPGRPGSPVAVSLEARWWRQEDVLAGCAERLLAWDAELAAGGSVPLGPTGDIPAGASVEEWAAGAVAAFRRDAVRPSGVAAAARHIAAFLEDGAFGSVPEPVGAAATLAGLLGDRLGGVNRIVWVAPGAPGLTAFVARRVLAHADLVETARALERDAALRLPAPRLPRAGRTTAVGPVA